MMNSLLNMILGCAHKRTTFPLTPSLKSKLPDGARSRTYIVCLNCGEEFEYNWKEMRIGRSARELSVSPTELRTEKTLALLDAEAEPPQEKLLPALADSPMPDSRRRPIVMHTKAVQLTTEVIPEMPSSRRRGRRPGSSMPEGPSHRTRLPARTA
jgi:hypothetical protein